jgi:hypothetical protein
MSIQITTHPSEEESRIRELLFANLFKVFDERDASKRSAAVQDTYAEEIVWYEPDRLVKGLEALDARAAVLQGEAPGFKFGANGIMSVSQNVGVLRWNYGPDEKPDLVQGTDIIVVEDGKIKALWTTLDTAPGKP